MTRGEVERIIAPYVKRIEALEKEVAELKARPSGEQHTHHHYGQYTPAMPLPNADPAPWRADPIYCGAHGYGSRG